MTQKQLLEKEVKEPQQAKNDGNEFIKNTRYKGMTV
ncbi:hypothetical protein T03_16830 [Trichinella britovi]|uniref:Uncharacterized protein n=1 Tax=Trichinella britovi TaxID=45882 RepID=A0A0V1AJU7_TRIBR|nr:hypothetical protein T03_16830 [Trichinella britovi]KRZ63762.1 hypothetical protein T08_5427 [Trichinella sp. T8]KRZ64690.1 hypothetical protein T08_15770 [Trichinella sp. T8]